MHALLSKSERECVTRAALVSGIDKAAICEIFEALCVDALISEASHQRVVIPYLGEFTIPEHDAPIIFTPSRFLLTIIQQHRAKQTSEIEKIFEGKLRKQLDKYLEES